MAAKELSFKEMQDAAFGVMKYIDQICKENHWQYILTYGSMLGAVRHHGTIPWDDDIDIMMPRPDYDAMQQYFSKHQEELMPYKWFDHFSVPAYPHMIARISDQRYHLEFDNEKDYGIGAFVDVYPMDGVGNDYKKALNQIKKAKNLASLCFLTGRKGFGRDNTQSKLKMVIKFPAYLWAKMWGTDHYIKKLSNFTDHCDYKNSKYLACIAWPSGIVDGRDTDIFERSYLEDTVRVPFEDSMLPIPKQYDAFLTRLYGNYMQPPPEDKRTTNHTYRGYLL